MHYMGRCLFAIQVSSLFASAAKPVLEDNHQQSEGTEMPTAASRGQQKLFQKQILKPALVNSE